MSTYTDYTVTPAAGKTHRHLENAMEKRLVADEARITALEAAVRALQPPPVIVPAPVTGYVIAPNGSDTAGTGSEASPWATLAKFHSVARPGDTLNCRGGRYTVAGTVRVTSVGTAAAPITVRAYPGEVPQFTSGTQDMLLAFDQGAAFHVVEGLSLSAALPGVQAGKGAVVWIGNGTSSVGSTRTGPVTLRNCTISKVPAGASSAHGVYASWMATGVLLDGCTLVGDFAETGNSEQAGLHVYHSPGATGTVMRHCLVRNWANGFLMIDPAADAQILHSTFAGNRWHVKADQHGPLAVRDCAGDRAAAGSVYDPAGTAVQDHDWWGLALAAPGYALPAGSAAIGGASDGTDAGR